MSLCVHGQLLQLAALSLVAVVAMRPDLLPELNMLRVSPPITGLIDHNPTPGPENRIWWLSRKNWTDGRLHNWLFEILLLN